MSQFRTEIFLEKSNFLIDYKVKSFFIGSCFSDNIGGKLSWYKFPVLLNPFGVLYNPQSVAKSLQLIIEKKEFTGSDLQFANDKWFSYEHHGSFSSPDKQEVLKKINQSIVAANDFLQKTNVLFVTFGTAWYYRLKENKQIVANCHKQPAKLFNRELLDVKEVVELFTVVTHKLKDFNKDLQIVFTVSPVRHWKDGAVQNQLSKANLIVAIHDLVNKYEYCHYFPAYEIMMDDLRDYRFYTDDFLHPNNLAVDYIWSKFCDVFIEDKTLQISRQIEKINKALNHRPLHPETVEYKKFLNAQMDKISNFQNQFPDIDFSEEINYLQKELKKYG